MHRKRLAAALVLAVGVSPAVRAGTVTVDRVFADGVYAREIGMRPPATGEALYYPFSSDAGGTAADASGNGCDGAVSGCVWTGGGPHGGCMLFDGSDDYIDAGAAPNFPAWDQYSVSVWFLHNGGGDFGPGYGHKILDKTAWYHDWHLDVNPSDGHVGLSVYEGGGAGYGMGAGDRNYMDGLWHHAVVVRDGVSGWFWVDGVLTGASSNMVSVSSGSDVCVGNSFSGDGYQQKCWSGCIDEVRIYGRALSSNEVLRLYLENGLPQASGAARAAVSVATNLTVAGSLTVTGSVTFARGVFYSKPLGDLSCGVYTNAP